MPTRYDVSREELTELLDGTPRYRVDQVWSGLYEQITDPEDWTNLPKALRADLAERLPSALRLVTESASTGGDTVKFLWELEGGSRVETVLMLYPDRATVCISSQAGCAMGCGFCATGQAGFTRHLTVGEIVEQVARATRRARESDRRVSNVVYMGMGEPLANESTVWESVERLHGTRLSSFRPGSGQPSPAQPGPAMSALRPACRTPYTLTRRVFHRPSVPSRCAPASRR